MIITTNNDIKIYQTFESVYDGIDDFMDSEGRNFIELTKIIINKNSQFKTPIFLSSYNEKIDKTFKRKTKWYIKCDDIILDCKSEEIADKLFNKIALVLEFGDEPLKTIDNLFVF